MSVQLRNYQVQLIKDIYSSWTNGYRNVMAVSPTGSGKAFTLCTLAQELAYTHRMETTIKVHRKELVSQLCMSLAKLGVYHNVIAQKNTVLDIIEQERREFGTSFYQPNSPITVVSVDTLLSRKEKYKEWGDRQKVWILDEAAHQLKDNKWGKVTEMMPNALGVGFTATPQRLDKKGLGRHAFGLFDVMVQGPTVRHLIDRGYLSKYKVVVPPSQYREFLKDDDSDSKDYTHEAREYASIHSGITGDVVDNYIKFINGKQAIVFADSIKAGMLMEANFAEKGIAAKLLTGSTPDKERLKGVNDYRDGKVKVLINVDLFDEGFDVPGTYAVIMARPTKSLSKFLQMCLDTDTEVLTKRGWLKHNEITKSDIVAGFNTSDSGVEWCEIKELFERPRENEDMFNYSNSHLDFRITSEHDLIVKGNSDTCINWVKETVDKTYQRKSMFKLPVSGFENVKDYNIKDTELELLGWFMSDGTISKKSGQYQMTISQSVSHMLYIKEIRNILNKLKIPFSEHRVIRKDSMQGYPDLIQISVGLLKPKRTFKRWKGKKDLSHILNWFDKSLPEIYNSLSRRQVKILMSTWFKGDGYKLAHVDYEPKTMSITMGGDVNTANKLQALLVTRGFRCNLHVEKRIEGLDNYIIRIKDTTYTTVAGSSVKDGVISGKKTYKRARINKETSNITENVWCLSNRLGTIITRRNGKVVIMGNCGRSLRVALGKDFAVLIDHVGNIKYHGLPDKIRRWTLDNIVKKRERVNLIRICGNTNCNSPFDRALHQCPFCGHEDHKTSRSGGERSPKEALEMVDGDLELLDPETIRELEREIDLEDPDSIAERVTAAAGAIAGKGARKRQIERIEMQKVLSQTIAEWAGIQKQMHHYSDRSIKKKFYNVFNETITVALSLTRADMERINNMIRSMMWD